MEMARKQFEGRTGASIGRSILDKAQSPTDYNNVSDRSGGILNIQGISQALTPMASRIQEIANQKQQTLDYSNSLSLIVNEIKNVHGAITALDDNVKSLTPDYSQLLNALSSVENAIRAIPSGNNYDIDINQQGFVVGSKSDADNLARSTANSLQVGLGNGGL